MDEQHLMVPLDPALRARLKETATRNGMTLRALVEGLMTEGLARLAAEGYDVAPLRSDASLVSRICDARAPELRAMLKGGEL